MMMIAFGATRLISEVTARITPALVLRRSSRLMPGLRGMPAVTMKRSEPAQGS